MEANHESRIGRRSGRLVINDLPANSMHWTRIGLIAIILFLLCNVVFLQVKLHGLRQKVNNELPPLSKETTPNSEKLVGLKKQLGSVEDETDELKRNFATIESETNRLEDTVHEISARAEQMAMNVDRLSNKSQNLENELESTKTSWAALGEDVKALNVETRKNISDLTRKAEDRNSKLSNEMQIHQNALNSLATAEKEVENRFKSHETDFNKYKSDTEDKLRELHTIRDNLFALRKSLDSVEDDSKRIAKSLSLTQFDVQKGVKALNDKQNQLSNQVQQQRVQLQASIANLERLIKSPTDDLAKAASDYNKLMSDVQVLMRDGNETLKQMKTSEDTLRVEIEAAKAVVQGEALKNLSSHIQNTEAYVQTVVELMNANTLCGGKFIALASSQQFQIAHLRGQNDCTYTVLAPSGKRIEYTLPEYSASSSSSVTINDGKKWNYDGDDTDIKTRTTKDNTLVVTFNSSWYYSGRKNLYITYKAV